MARHEFRRKRKNEEGVVEVAVITGADARALRDAAGRRRMGPYRVFLTTLMSPLSVNTDVLEIVLYWDDPKQVINVASEILKRFYRGLSLASAGYPKPHGEASLELLEDDKSFEALYRDAKREAAAGGHRLKHLGPYEDPTAFHVVRMTPRIIVPSMVSK